MAHIKEFEDFLNESQLQLPGAPGQNDPIEILKNPDPNFQKARALVQEYLKDKIPFRMDDLVTYLSNAENILDEFERNVSSIVAAMKDGLRDNMKNMK